MLNNANKYAIAVIGGGNGAHAITAIAASRGYEVRVWAPLKDEADALNKGIAEQGGIVALIDGTIVKGCPVRVSSEPEDIIPFSNLIIFVLPAFAHKSLLLKIKPYLKKGDIIGAMPSRSGFEFMARSIVPHDVTIFGNQSLPWSCRIKEYGKAVNIVGTKDQLKTAASPISETEKVCSLLQDIVGIPFIKMPNMLCLSLSNVGQILHPGIMYSLFHNWDGCPFSADKIPLFYEGITVEDSFLLEKISQEILDVTVALEKSLNISLSGVTSLQDQLIASYEESIDNNTTLYGCITTNSAYYGIKAPVKAVGANQYIPNFQSRYLTEDLPYGLVVTKALAQLTNTTTPVIDQIIIKTSQWSEKEYLVDGKLTGKDLKEAPLPKNYSINTLNELYTIIS